MLVHRVLPAAALVAGVVALALVLRPAFEPTPPLTVSVRGTEVVVVTSKPAIVRLEYGPSRRYGLFSPPQGPLRRHSFSLASLPPGSTYHLRAVVGSRTSGDAILRTQRGPHRLPGKAVAFQPVEPSGPQAWLAILKGRARATFAPALAAPPAAVTLENRGTDVYATRRNGAVTIFAANSSPAQSVAQIFYVPGLAGRSVRVWNSGRVIRGKGNSFADTLPPFAWRVYVVAPR